MSAGRRAARWRAWRRREAWSARWSPQHGLDGADAGDGVLGEREGHGDGADEFAVDVDGAAAHALHDAGMFQRSAGEAGEDEGFLGADIVEHAEDFDLELLDLVAVEDGAAGAAHAGSEVLEGKERSLGG